MWKLSSTQDERQCRVSRRKINSWYKHQISAIDLCPARGLRGGIRPLQVSNHKVLICPISSVRLRPVFSIPPLPSPPPSLPPSLHLPPPERLRLWQASGNHLA